MRHKHTDVITAWAEGKNVSFFDKITKSWVPYIGGQPFFNATLDWRIDPDDEDPNESPLIFQELLVLTMAIWNRCYKDEAPHFEALDTSRGLISQIDNMVAGLMNRLEAQNTLPIFTALTNEEIERFKR